jgi:triacylglycerol lipase
MHKTYYKSVKITGYTNRRENAWNTMRVVFLIVTLWALNPPWCVAKPQSEEPQSSETNSPASIDSASKSVAETAETAETAKKTESAAVPKKKKRPVRKYDRKRGIVFANPDGKSLRADLYVPNGQEKQESGTGRLPGIVMIHGGGWRTGNRFQMSGHANFVANRGYVVMSIDYRLAPDHKWPAQIHDCKAAVRWLRIHADEYSVDPDRIGTYGYSAGGHLASLLGTTTPADGLEGEELGGGDVSSTVSAVVAGGAPCDIRIMPPDAKFLYYWLGSTRRQSPATYEAASPAAYVSSQNAPSFFYHGANDWIVPVYSSIRMSRSLAEAGVTTRHFEIKGRGHIVSFMDGGAMRAAVEFLDQHLKPQ